MTTVGPDRRTTFGPTALATPANAITVARLMAAPVVVILVLAWGPTWPAAILAIGVAATDGIDGWLARRHGTTTSGAFLDPLADKAVVLGAFVAVAWRGEISWWPVAAIAVREVSMQVYRSALSRREISIPARTSAKIKTVVQDAAMGLCLVPEAAHHRTLVGGAMLVATAFTLFTGAQYLMDGWRAGRVAVPPDDR